MVEAFLLLSRCVVPHEVLIRAEDACGLHCAAALRAQDALDHDAATHVERPAIVANPVVVGNFVDTIAPLVHWNIASSTKDDKVLILVVAVVADGTLGIFLDDKASLMGTERVVSLDIEAVDPVTIGVVATLC